MNKVFLVGRLTKAPELKTTPNGVSVATFTLAVNRRGTEAGADFLPIVAWRTTAELCGKYLSKGQKAAVSGEIQTRSYEAKDGSRRYVTEINASEVEFLEKPQGREKPSAEFAEEMAELLEAELPF